MIKSYNFNHCTIYRNILNELNNNFLGDLCDKRNWPRIYGENKVQISK